MLPAPFWSEPTAPVCSGSLRKVAHRHPRPVWTRLSAKTHTAFLCSCPMATSSSTSGGQSSTRIALSIWRRWMIAKPRKRLLVTDSYVAVGDETLRAAVITFCTRKNDTLWAHSFDTTRGELSGDPVAISEDVGLFTVSATGTLVSRQTSAEQTQLTWFDRGGKALGTLGPVGDYWGIQLSPDNTRVAAVYHRALSGYFAIWLIDVARNLATPFSLESERSMAPAWSPDSARLYFASTSRNEQIFSKAADDANAERVLSSPGKVISPLDVSPNGMYLLGALSDSAGTASRKLVYSTVGKDDWRRAPRLELQGTIRSIFTRRQMGRLSVERGRRPKKSGSPTFPAPTRGIESPIRRPGTAVEGGRGRAVLRERRRHVDGCGYRTRFGIRAIRPVVSRGPLSASEGWHYTVTSDGQKFLVQVGRPDQSRTLNVVFNWPQIVHAAR